MQNKAWQGRAVGHDPEIQCLYTTPKNAPGCHRKECPLGTVETVPSFWSDCVRSAWGSDAEMDVLVEKLWPLQVPGSVAALGRAVLRRWREGRSCCCADVLIVSLESPMPWDGWRWDHTIRSSLMQCSHAAGGLCAACLKQLIALPKTRRVL